MNSLELVQEGILYCNPHPSRQAVCATSPNVVPLSDRELLCICRVGQALFSDDGKLAQLRSFDGGVTWVEDGLVRDPGDDSAPYTYSAPHASRLRNGTLLLVSQRLLATDEYPSHFNPETGGIQPTEIVFMRSDDQGRSWTPPAVLELPDNADLILDAPSAILELNDGRWFLACERWKAWHDPSPLHIRGFALFSEDEGKTWGGRVDFPSVSDADRMYSHTRYTKMHDGRIAACQWAQSIGGQVTHDLHFVSSDETGSVWTHPKATGIPGQNSWIADLGDGVLVLVYASREREDVRPGVRVVYSEDGGATWDLKNQLLLWDALGQNFIGQTHEVSYPASHDNIAFGKVNAVCLPDGEVLCSWWCTQGCIVHMRYARLRVKPRGG